MKMVIISFICISAVLFALLIHSDINAWTSCEQELEEALSLSISQTVKEVMEQKSYGIENRNEFIAAFLQALILRTNSEADMTISVLAADMEKGLLDIEVRECLCSSAVEEGVFEDRDIVVRRTVIFERPLPSSVP